VPYVKRSENGEILAVSQTEDLGFDEELQLGDAELSNFLIGLEVGASAMEAADKRFIRVLEDVVQLLIDTRVILFTDLPPLAQEEILYRQRLRSALSIQQDSGLDLIGED
jgi:hypothetical protein